MITIPGNFFDDNKIVKNISNLTIREYFAAMAMQGLLSNKQFVQDVVDEGGKINNVAKASVEASNALIAELNKQ